MLPSNDVTLACVTLENVTVEFSGLIALNDISFSVFPNEIVGLIGPNGAGKTTAFNVICGFTEAQSGTVRFPLAGKNNLRPHQLATNGIARTLQGVGLFPSLSVLENVMSGGASRPGSGFWTSLLSLPAGRTSQAQLRGEALALLERFGLENYADASAAAIPYGISKKVSVARALMSRPSLLLLDEPASGLDESELEDFSALIRDLRSTTSVLLVEHNMDFVMPLVDRLVVLNFGTVIATGTAHEVVENPEVIAAYLGANE